MLSGLGELQRQLRAIWTRLDGAQRTTVGAVLFATVLGLAGVVWYAGQPDYETVFRANEARDLQVAQEALLQNGIPFRVDGNRLLVDRDQSGAALGALQAADLETPDLQERIDALSNLSLDRDGQRSIDDQFRLVSLERDLRALPGVRQANIAWQRPERSVYRKFDKAETHGATVTLRLNKGASFQSVARVAISMVADGLLVPESMVDVFAPETDDWLSGDPLALGGGKSSRGDDFDRYEMQISEQRRAELQRFLDLAYEGQVAATVKIDLERVWQQTTERIMPSGERLQSQTRRTDEGRPVRSESDPSTADPSAGSVASGRPRTVGGSEEIESTFDTSDVGTRQSGQWAALIRRVGVSLLIHDSLAGEAKKIAEVVQNVAGSSDDDQPAEVVYQTVSKLPERVLPSPATPPEASGGGFERVTALAPHIAQVLAVLVVLFFLRSLMRGGGQPRESRRAKKVAALAAAAGGGATAPQGAMPSDADPMTRARRDVERSIAEDPAGMSRVVENWLTEHRS